MKANPQPFEYDFDGACDPAKSNFRSETFSLGIFQWIPKSSRRGLKRSAVIKRFRGPVHDAEKVRAAAQAFCDEKNGVPK
jgi:hypothetical protein